MADYDNIHFFDASGTVVEKLPRTNHKRFSQRAAADHRIMDAFKARCPQVEGARIGTIRFVFRNGRSQMAPGQI